MLDAVVGDAAEVDRVDAACQGARLPPIATCGAAVVEQIPSRGAGHVPEAPISYVDNPPSSGDHRPAWARWGEYDYLPPQRWLHNLEHGGIALLYDPCADEATVTALGDFARARADDEGGPFRWVLTPYPGLPTRVAVVAWEWTWQAGCTAPEGGASLEAFVTDHYRKAPEDVAADGSYTTGWIGR